MEEMKQGQKGEKNGNMALLERFTQALLGQSVLQDIAEGWDDEDYFRDHPDRRMPAFMMIMMPIKRTRNLNQTINLVSTSDEAEIMPNGGRYDKEKSITPGSCRYANGPLYHRKDQRP